MAKKEATKTGKGSGLKKKLTWGVIGLALIGGSVGAALYVTQSLGSENSADAAQVEGGDGDATLAAEKAPPQYLSLDPPFIVNFDDQEMLRYLQVGVSVMARDKAVIDQVTNNLPHIRNNLIMLFGSQDEKTLHSTEGKETLRHKALEEIQAILQKEIGDPGVEDVYFTSFVMQ